MTLYSTCAVVLVEVQILSMSRLLIQSFDLLIPFLCKLYTVWAHRWHWRVKLSYVSLLVMISVH